MSVQDRIFCQVSFHAKPENLVFRPLWIIDVYQKGKKVL